MTQLTEERFVATSLKPSQWFIMDTDDFASITFVNERPMLYKNDADHLAKRLNEIAARNADKLPRLLYAIRAGTAKGTPPAQRINL